MQIFSTTIMKVLQAQNNMLLPALLAFVSFLLNIGMNVWFIKSYGFLGSSLATSATRTVQVRPPSMHPSTIRGSPWEALLGVRGWRCAVSLKMAWAADSAVGRAA